MPVFILVFEIVIHVLNAGECSFSWVLCGKYALSVVLDEAVNFLWPKRKKSRQKSQNLWSIDGLLVHYTRNSSEDEIANVNFLYDDIVHAVKIQ